MIKHVLTPTASEALKFIEKYHRSTADKTILIIIGECLINYHGRARSLLDWGERIVMIKQDGTIIVHQPVMREPVNWQPAGTITRFDIKNHLLNMKSYHTHPPEKMNISFRDIKIIVVASLHDHAQLLISGMETDIVNEIVSNPGVIEEGLRISKREKHVKSGIIDLFGYDKNHVPVVIEVKRSQATISAVQQLRMYVNDMKRDIETANVRGILCAPKIPDMVKKLLSDYGLEWREVERRIVLPDDKQKTLKDF